jgi:hypothetical protein
MVGSLGIVGKKALSTMDTARNRKPFTEPRCLAGRWIDGVQSRRPPRIIVLDVVSRGCLYFPGSRLRVWSRGTQAVSVGCNRGHGNDAFRSVPRGRVCRGGSRSAPDDVSAVNTVVFSPVVPRVVSVIVVAVISRRWWRCDKTRYRPHSSADCGAEGRTVTPCSGSPDCSPAAGADETAPQSSVERDRRD